MAFTKQNLETVKKWINTVTEANKLTNWNIVLFGVEHGVNSRFAGYSLNKVRRSRKYLREGTIDLGVLTDPKEKVADVEYNKLNVEGRQLYDKYRTDSAQRIREYAGLEITPNLVIYVVDKDSHATGKNRHDLKSPYDITGISINIPGDRINDSYACSVMIDLSKYGLGSDLEGEDEYED